MRCSPENAFPASGERFSLACATFLQNLKSLQLNNSPGGWARELFKPSTDSASLKPANEIKTFFVVDLGFSGDDVTRGVFWVFFGKFYLALSPNPISHYFGSTFFRKLGQNPHL